MKCKKIIKFIGGLVLSLSLLFSTTCVEAAKTGMGTQKMGGGNVLQSKVLGNMLDGERLYSASADSTCSVPRIRAKISVHYRSTGAKIDGDIGFWNYNAKNALTTTIDMHHFYNNETGKWDKFVNTPCTAYGTADAIYNGAGYAAYSSVTY